MPHINEKKEFDKKTFFFHYEVLKNFLHLFEFYNNKIYL